MVLRRERREGGRAAARAVSLVAAPASFRIVIILSRQMQG
jgi:hypothetical protein